MKTSTFLPKTLISIILIFFPLFTQAWVGSGTASDPFKISKQKDYKELQTKVSNGNTFSNTYFILTSDIKITIRKPGIGFKSNNSNKTKYFEGNFDGNNYSITFTNKGSTFLFCMFEAIRNAQISNLSIKSNHSGYCGMIDLAEKSTILFCKNHGDINQNKQSQLSGIVNLSKGCTIVNCSNYGNIHGANWCAGIVGQINQTGDTHTLVKDCNNYGNININSNYAGGITANATNNLTIIHCSNQGTINGENYIAGIASNIGGNCSISTSMNTGTINFSGQYAGGITAQASSTNTIEYCGNYGGIQHTSFSLFSSSYAAGIVGYDYNNTSIKYCIQTAEITKNSFEHLEKDPIVNKKNNNTSTIKECYYNGDKFWYWLKNPYNGIEKKENELKGTLLKSNDQGDGWTSSNWNFENGKYPYPIPYKNNTTSVRANVRYMNDGVLYDYFLNISTIKKNMVNTPNNAFDQKYQFVGWSTDTLGRKLISKTKDTPITDQLATQHQSSNYDLVLYAIWSTKKSNNGNNKGNAHNPNNKGQQKKYIYRIHKTTYIENEMVLTKTHYNNIVVKATGSLNANEEISCNRLILESHQDSMPQIISTNPINITNGWIFSRQINDLRWFHMALPYNCQIENIYSTKHLAIYDRNWFLKKYDPIKRCQNGSGTSNWTRLDTKETLQSNKGYIIGTALSGKQTFYFKSNSKLTTINYIPTKKLKVFVAHTNNSKAIDNNWNFVGNPYLHNLKGEMTYAKPSNLRSKKQVFITYPEIDTSIHFHQGTLQDLSSSIKPFLPLYIQTEEDAEIQIIDQKPKHIASNNKTTDNSVYIKLNIQNQQKTRIDWTSLVFEAQGKKEFEAGYDYEKIIDKTKCQLYSQSNQINLLNNNLPYYSMSNTNLGLYIDSIGDYTISINQASNTGNIYLTDKQTGMIINLKNENYTFKCEEVGVFNNRFSLSVQKNKIPTSIENTDITLPIININNQEINIQQLDNIKYITIYNTIGQAITSFYNLNNKIHTTLPSKGIYYIHFITKQNKKVTKTITI